MKLLDPFRDGSCVQTDITQPGRGEKHSTCSPIVNLQAPHDGTVRTMFHIILSIAIFISSAGSARVLVSAAQHMPVAVRTMIEVVPGRLPLCHQFPAPLS